MTRSFRLAAATGLHQGDRPYQQDQVLIMTHPRVSGCVLGVVADGMGGRSGGRKASDQVLMTARQLFGRYKPGRDEPVAVLRQILDDAHTVIKLTAVSSEQEPHSTLAAFLMNPEGDCAWVHAGDSRIYHFNILLGCLGMKSTPPPVDIHFIPRMVTGDVLMACSDGLWHYFTPEEMGALLSDQPPRAAVELLVAEARRRARGTGDNISIVVLKLEPLPVEA